MTILTNNCDCERSDNEFCHFSDGQLVKFRCMVQDMFDPEYYVASYRVRSVKDGSVKLRCGRFRDVGQCGPGEEVSVL